ncbi:ParM/StbA family protein [Pseudomonas aeruginosa]|uniref:ParM/StbA family protein n=1 Tax=Pseudomonas aeruginosa TaxID=287 RepID=UPI0032B4F7A2
MANEKQAAKVQSKPVPALFVDDNGFAYHKSAYFDESGKIECQKRQSIVVVGNNFSSASGNAINRYLTDGTEYSCPSASVDAIDIRNGDYPLSPANRVLVNHALAKADFIGRPVKLGVTLPFRDFYTHDGAINEARRAAVGKNFSAKVSVVGSEAQPQIESVHVWAEGISAFFDWALRADGNPNPQLQELEGSPMAVIDIGGQTTDIVSISYEEGKLVIDNKRSETKEIGVLDAIKALQTRVSQSLAEKQGGTSSMYDQIPLQVAERIIQTGKGRIGADETDFSDLRNQVLREHSEMILAFIKSKLGNLNNYPVLYFIGGGAIVFQDVLKSPNAQFGDEFSNARGALKYMRYVAAV